MEILRESTVWALLGSREPGVAEEARDELVRRGCPARAASTALALAQQGVPL